MDEAGCVIRDFKGDPVMNAYVGIFCADDLIHQKNFLLKKGAFGQMIQLGFLLLQLIATVKFNS